MAIVDSAYDIVDGIPPTRAAETLNAAVGVVIIRRMALGIIGIHCVSLSDCRNRLDL